MHGTTSLEKSLDLFIINSFRNCDAAEWSAARVILVRVSDYQHKDNNSISQINAKHVYFIYSRSLAPLWHLHAFSSGLCLRLFLYSTATHLGPITVALASWALCVKHSACVFIKLSRGFLFSRIQVCQEPTITVTNSTVPSPHIQGL